MSISDSSGGVPVPGPTAWIDESGSNGEVDPGTYVLGAAVVAPGAEDDVREAMKKLKLNSSGPKLHWRAESSKRRQQITEVIAGLEGLQHVVVVREGSVEEKSERRRRKCIERLLHELELHEGVHRATFEGRGTKDNQRDVKMLLCLLNTRMLGQDFRITHVNGPAEPLLWVPDSVCGAVVADRLGEPDYLKVYNAGDVVPKIQVIDL